MVSSETENGVLESPLCEHMIYRRGNLLPLVCF